MSADINVDSIHFKMICSEQKIMLTNTKMVSNCSGRVVTLINGDDRRVFKINLAVLIIFGVVLLLYKLCRTGYSIALSKFILKGLNSDQVEEELLASPPPRSMRPSLSCNPQIDSNEDVLYSESLPCFSYPLRSSHNTSPALSAPKPVVSLPLLVVSKLEAMALGKETDA